MKIYIKYLLAKISQTFLLFNCVFLGLICLTQILKYTSLMNKGAMLIDIVDIVLLSMPSILFIILPLSTCLSVIYCYFKRMNNGEMILLRIMGLNNMQIASPGLLFSLAITLISYYLALVATPKAFTMLKNRVFELRNNYSLELVQENSFNTITKNITIYLGNKIDSNSFDNIIIFDKGQPAKLFVAEKGALQFNNGTLELKLDDGVLQTFKDNINTDNLAFNQFAAKIDLYSNKSIRDTKDMDEHNLSELLKTPKPKFIAEAHRRITWPAYNLLLTCFALGITLQNSHQNFINKMKIAIYTISVVCGYFIMYILAAKHNSSIPLVYFWSAAVLSFSINKLLKT